MLGTRWVLASLTGLIASLPACCAALTELALNDTNAHQVVQVRAPWPRLLGLRLTSCILV